ncbi:MAG: hypothetical protein GWO41_13790 [candidate division Zixibacteria bacterium]|nr:hypothetical protein [candidate division Zixibacteria bacterium]NIR63353.1 hypothetical protein [candidate division Zixibacteria bacterium]NIS17450.1 hypothetical protein [candidate division Zixibacteria bacterium]NIS45348.1 hypothetical protein [candidate division Zixibacteria bacterium]NIT53767.1 hypothetical protein [candidate division Zixibacteria bacterium]
MRISNLKSVGIAMMFSWYDKKVMSAIITVLVLSTAGILVIDHIMRMTGGPTDFVITNQRSPDIRIMMGEDATAVMRETFLYQTNRVGSEEFWTKYRQKSMILPCQGNCSPGVEYILIVPIIKLKYAGSDYVELRDEDKSKSLRNVEIKTLK